MRATSGVTSPYRSLRLAGGFERHGLIWSTISQTSGEPLLDESPQLFRNGLSCGGGAACFVGLRTTATFFLKIFQHLAQVLDQLFRG
jgi:hypothetical protein